MQFHPINHGGAVDMNTAAAGFGDALLPPHVAQRSRRDKLRFPVPGAAADAMLASAYEGYDDAAFPLPPPPDPSYVARASAADLGYLHAIVSPPRRPAAAGEQWPTSPQYDASGSGSGSGSWAWARPLKVEHDEGETRAGFAAHHQGAATLSLTLQSPGTQELPQAYGGSLQSVVGAGAAAAGPLCPFTGYAAVLKGSRFLRPAQQLLDEICAALVGSERSCWSAGAGGSCSLASPYSLSSSTDTGDRQHHRPEFREKKTKLLYMQEEVCRRYKQYHQQIQMVVSSFESIPGLSSATPYASSVLKAISRHFRRVRSGISSQIQYISRLLGEELLSLPSSSRGGKTLARLGLTEQSQPVWRSQRGLPERAVSVLRAWLFDHFLHPYPTDADKHMLATQTGLTRNQVSNWFINARVRLWKPMVEEIHILETRGAAITNAPATASSSDRVAPPVGVGVGSHHQHKYQLQQEQQQWLDVAPPIGVHVGGGDQVVMSFGGAAPLPEMGGEFGAAAAVSLMLGLRRDVSYQRQQHYQQQFGVHILGDLVG